MVSPYFLAALGLMAVPCACMGMAIRAFIRKKPLTFVRVPAWLMLAIVTFFVGDCINWATLQAPAERAHAAMISDGRGLVGEPASSLRATYGPPKQIFRDPKAPRIEHWWYTPGPWFIVEDDYVGFLVEDGVVKEAYLQVN